MEHMRILHICPTSRIESPLAPESLQYLGHQIERWSLDQLRAADTSAITADVIAADACRDLSVAPTIAEVVAKKRITAPVIVVLSESGLATASTKWNVADIVLTTAGPAEVDARLRVARDEYLSHPQSLATRIDNSVPSSTPSSTSSSEGPWNAEGEPMIVVSGALRIDETSFTANLGGRSLDLTYREFALLKFFAMHPDRAYTRGEILLRVWGDDYYGGTRTVDVHVRRVRAKLGKDLENAIHTVRNVGYRFSPDFATEDGAESKLERDDESASASEDATRAEPGEPEEESNEEDVKV